MLNSNQFLLNRSVIISFPQPDILLLGSFYHLVYSERSLWISFPIGDTTTIPRLPSPKVIFSKQFHISLSSNIKFFSYRKVQCKLWRTGRTRLVPRHRQDVPRFEIFLPEQNLLFAYTTKSKNQVKLRNTSIIFIK